MKRRDFLRLAPLVCATPGLAAPAERFSRGLLWRVTRKGLPTSHVYGTTHVADKRLAVLPPQVLKTSRLRKA